MSGTVTFVGKSGVDTFVAIGLKAGIKLYAEHGIRPNRQWTPKAMLEKAGSITGRKFKRGQYEDAIIALTSWIEENGTNGTR